MVKKTRKTATIFAVSIIIIMIIISIIIASSIKKNVNVSNISSTPKTLDISSQEETVVITLKNIEETTNPDYVIHDSDLKELITLLYDNGATEILINDIKIQLDTIIESSLDINHSITINNITITSPYTIKAFGNSNKLYEAVVSPGSYYKILETFNIPVNVEKF